MLEIRGLSVRYGQIQALDRLDMRVEEGEIISVIGANGCLLYTSRWPSGS